MALNNTTKIKALLKEWEELDSEIIGFMAAGKNNSTFTPEMNEREKYVNKRMKEVETELFPLLTERKTITFDKTPRPELWAARGQWQDSGWIEVESTAQCDQFNCETVSGILIFAKLPK